MTHIIEHETRQLEQVTAPTTFNNRPTDPENAALRETWIALSGLLETTSADMPAPAFDAAIDTKPAAVAAPTRSSVRWIMAMAATLLLALAGTSLWYLVMRHQVTPIAQQERLTPKTAVVAQSETNRTTNPHKNKTTRSATTADPALAWDDDLEQPLQQAWLCAFELQDGKSTIDALRDHVSNDISILQQEISDRSAL